MGIAPVEETEITLDPVRRRVEIEPGHAPDLRQPAADALKNPDGRLRAALLDSLAIHDITSSD
jgi:hypothetical protein